MSERDLVAELNALDRKHRFNAEVRTLVPPMLPNGVISIARELLAENERLRQAIEMAPDMEKTLKELVRLHRYNSHDFDMDEYRVVEEFDLKWLRDWWPDNDGPRHRKFSLSDTPT